MHRILPLLLLVLVAVPVTLTGSSLLLALASEWRHPPIGAFVEVGGQRLHLYDSGVPSDARASDLPLVLVHGASTSLLDLRVALAGRLDDARRVVLVDRPGHGYSDRGHGRGNDWVTPIDQARRIHESLVALGIDRAVWVGHSWGGAVLMAALVEFPEAVAGAVSIAGVSHSWEGGSASHVELAARDGTGLAFAWQFIEPGGRLTLRSALESVFAPEAVPEHYIEETGVTLSLRPWVYRHNAIDLTRLAGFLDALVPRYDEIERPVLSITGTADDVVPAWNHAERLDAELAHHAWVSLDGAGHGLHHTRNARIATLLLAFVDCLEHGPARACPLTVSGEGPRIRRPVRE